MSPKSDNQKPNNQPDVTVDIPHDEKPASPAPATAPPLPGVEPLPIRPINITDNSSTTASSPILPPVSQDEFHEHEGRRWPIILLYLITALLIAVLVVFAGRWIYRKTTHKTVKTTSTQQGNVPAAPATPATPAANTGSNSSASSNSAAAGKTTPVAGQLPNNGPGDVVAIFVGVALAVGGLHYIYGLRRT